jgi:hypothetical protein
MLASLDRFASPLGYAWILCLFVLLKFSLRWFGVRGKRGFFAEKYCWTSGAEHVYGCVNSSTLIPCGQHILSCRLRWAKLALLAWQGSRCLCRWGESKLVHNQARP